MEIDGKTKVLGVIGNPIVHTLSPVIHNTFAELTGINAVYVPICVENDIDGGNLIIDLIKKENEIAFVETDEWFTLKNFISCI